MQAQSIRLDDRDGQIVLARMAKLDAVDGPRVGDFVRFADGTLRRCSYHWTDDNGWDGGMQTSDDNGRFYLGEYGCSFSGALYSTVPTDSLVLEDEPMIGRAWIFHHDFAGAGRGVDFTIHFRVYSCELEPPR